MQEKTSREQAQAAEKILQARGLITPSEESPSIGNTKVDEALEAQCNETKDKVLEGKMKIKAIY